MADRRLEGQTALVTGASSGLGAEFARQLAAMGADLVLVARRADALEAIKAEIAAAHGVAVRVEPRDLGADGAARALHADVTADGVAVDILINNAGFGLWGRFLDRPLERIEALMQLDMVVLTQLSHLFGRDMVARGRGRMLQIASVGAYQPTPTYAVYSAAKAYVLLLGEALNHELKGTGVSCTVVSPGATATDFLKVAGQKPTFYERSFMMKTEPVVRTALRAMLRGRDSVVPGWRNLMTVQSLRLAPRRLNTWLAGLLMKSEPA